MSIGRVEKAMFCDTDRYSLYVNNLWHLKYFLLIQSRLRRERKKLKDKEKQRKVQEASLFNFQ